MSRHNRPVRMLTLGTAALGLTLLLGGLALMDLTTPHLATAQAQQTQAPPAQAPEPRTPAEPEETIHVGVYNPQHVFEAHPERDAALQRVHELAEQAYQAQQAGDQQAFAEAQQQLQEERERIVREFETAVNEAVAEIAEEQGLDVVAIEVAYESERVQTRDITEAIVAQFNGEAPPPIEIPDLEPTRPEPTEPGPAEPQAEPETQP